MDSFMTFLSMGGYAGFIWSAYGITALAFIALYVSTVRSLRQTEAELSALEGEAESSQADNSANLAGAANR